MLTSRAGPSMRTELGYTLLELMVVVFLTGLMALLALPRFQTFLGADPERDLRTPLENMVVAVREEAILSRTPVAIIFDLSANVYRSAVFTSEGSVDLSNDPVSLVGRLPKGFQVVEVSNPREGSVSRGQCFIIAWPTGWIEPTVIHIAHETGRSYTLFVEPLTGGVRIQEGYLVRRRVRSS